ncbi:MAG: preprotein translocase subunit SecG, partial [Candidatus Aureabacteria bacterium]|nr:preprotein translocase subunit SecG [Candidatus Auribacterota bacterium]
MVTFIQILHVILSIMLIGIILMQSSKGHGLSGAFGSFGGGAIQNAFGARTGDFLVKTTAYMTIIFFVSAFYLAYIQIMPGKSSSVLQNYKGVVSETPTKQAEEVGKKLGELTGDLLKKLKPSEEEPINKEIPPPPPPKNDSNVVKPLPVSQETSKEETLPAESSVPE